MARVRRAAPVVAGVGHRSKRGALMSALGPASMRRALVVLAVVLLAVACGSDDDPPAAGTTMAGDGALEISSDAFPPGGAIPTRHTCDGEDVSPRLFFTGIPENAEQLALVVDDPDAGGFVHWIAAEIATTARELAAGEPPGQYVPGPNDFGRSGWGGPCPPPGDGPHRYFFTLYALDRALGLPADAGPAEVRDRIVGAAIERASVTGSYER